MPAAVSPARRLLLCILDGWGTRAEREGNAILLAGTPEMDRLASSFPTVQLSTAGLAVGLPEGQMGNSEVGHTNIGAGRIVYQDLVRINRAAEGRQLGDVPAIREAMELAKANGRAFHLLGLVSRGGVHSMLGHLFALLEAARARGLPRVFVHAFLDGRDTPPQSGLGYLDELERFLAEKGAGTLATVSGRFYAMDRDRRWERVQRAYQAIAHGLGPQAPSAAAAVRAAYHAKVTDEFVEPTVIDPDGRMQDGDAGLFFNFRADRARELTAALTDPGFPHFERKGPKLSTFVCMTRYGDELGQLPVAFGPDQPQRIFPEILAERGLRQLRTSETEKYAHVTFFFNGGREVLFPGEDRHLVPSPRDVKTYDQKPEMSAREVTAELCRRIEGGSYHFALVNIANPDMVGHSGNLTAAIAAVKVVDECVGRLARACEKAGWAMMVTADHGNIEQMIDPADGGPHTAHTLNPVPLVLAHPDFRGQQLRPGVLADIAPTMLKVMELPQPLEMNRQGVLP